MNWHVCLVICLVLLALIFAAALWPHKPLFLASEIEVLLQPYADAVGPPTTLTFSGADLYVWWGDDALILRRHDHWYVAGFTRRGGSTLPPLFVVLMIQAMREREQQEVPTDPWGRPITDENVLHPEQRW